MAIDKAIDYVAQDGVKNYIKNSKSVTVPKEFKARKNAPATKLAYITADEAKMLKKMKKGTPHKGPKGIPSYDSFDAQGNFRSGEEMSAAERGDAGAFGKDPGARQEAQDMRSAAIAAGAGQRVNPGLFDSRNRISPQELALARQFTRRGDATGDLARLAMRGTRGGSIMNFIRSGGILGNLARGLGQKLGLGKRFNEPTYDMRGLDSVNPVFDDGSNEDLLSLIGTGGITDTVPFDADTFDDDVNLMNTKPSGGTILYDEFIPGMKNDDNRVLPKNLDLGLPNDLYAEVMQDDIDKSKTKTFKAMDFDTYKMINPKSKISEFEFEELKKGNITEPGTYTT